MNILVIDNIDSFVYNLVQYIGELGAEPVVFQNNDSCKEIEKAIRRQKIKGIIISPGPKTPKEAGISNEIIKKFGKTIPLLGVCLGHQCIGYSYGGTVGQANRIMHGKSSMIHHTGQGVFTGLTNPFSAIRYHSLVVKREGLPDCFEITAWTDDDEIMGLKHKQHPVEGIQFHPESFMTQAGKDILRNFLKK